MTELPAPLTPSDCDLRGICREMPMPQMFFHEPYNLLAAPDILIARIRLMEWAWASNPTASIPECDGLFRAARLSRRRWNKVRDEVLHSWVLCRDGRYYHPDLADLACRKWEVVCRLRRQGKRIDVRSHEWRTLRAAIFERDDYTCGYCGERGGRLECDHVVPVSQGGDSDPDNLVTACLGCNRSKAGKRPEEWLDNPMLATIGAR